jgi:predicted GNAT family acetyltransferase
MDTDEFPLGPISENSLESSDVPSRQSTTRSQRSPAEPSEHVDKEHQPATNMSSTRRDKFRSSNTSIDSRSITDNVSPSSTKRYIEVTSVTDEDTDENTRQEQQQRLELPSAHPNAAQDQGTMVSSQTTGGGGDNDVIEIHQFSSNDLDVYLDIYFETLNNRLRHYIGRDDEQIQQFRSTMKTRISRTSSATKFNVDLVRLDSDPTAREFQSVLLGKMNGEVVAAVTMLFEGESPSISQTSSSPESNSCLSFPARWLINKANYVPANVEECYIEMIGVKSAHRNHGIGAAMLECVEHFARQAGANLLTIHASGQQLQNYFERSGFHVDRTDKSSWWKWIVERQSTNKLAKNLSANDNDGFDYTTGSYLNESMVESIHEE